MQPSYVGYVATGVDAALLFETCLQGYLPLIHERVDPLHRSRLIASGHIFIYMQEECNIQRWTDGLKWSPSRVLGDFLIYRELEGQLPQKMQRKMTTITQDNDSDLKLWEKHLYGSLIDSYNFKDNGLVKKTVAVRIGSSSLRLVSYYRASDIVTGRLRAPSTDWVSIGMDARAQICSPTADGVCRSPSTNLPGANTSVVPYHRAQDPQLNTKHEIFLYVNLHSDASYPASWHHCNQFCGDLCNGHNTAL